MSDPMERRIAAALDYAGIEYTEGDDNDSKLDFRMTGTGVEIEVKRFHSPRISDQMARSRDVIVAQGDLAVYFLADAIEAMSARSSDGRAPEQASGGEGSTPSAQPFRDAAYETLLHRWKAQQAALRGTVQALEALRGIMAMEDNTGVLERELIGAIHDAGLGPTHVRKPQSAEDMA